MRSLSGEVQLKLQSIFHAIRLSRRPSAETNANYIAALNELAAINLQRSIVVAKEDANFALKRLVATNRWDDKRAVACLIHMEWRSNGLHRSTRFKQKQSTFGSCSH